MSDFKHCFTENSFFFRYRKVVLPLFFIAIVAFLILFSQYCMPLNNAIMIVALCFVCVLSAVTKSNYMSKYILYEMSYFDAYKRDDVDKTSYSHTLIAYSTVLSFIHYSIITLTIFTIIMMSKSMFVYREENNIEYSILIANLILGVLLSILGFLFVRKTTRLFNLNPIKSIYSDAARVYYNEKDRKAPMYINTDGGLIIGDVVFCIGIALCFGVYF